MTPSPSKSKQVRIQTGSSPHPSHIRRNEKKCDDVTWLMFGALIVKGLLKVRFSTIELWINEEPAIKRASIRIYSLRNDTWSSGSSRVLLIFQRFFCWRCVLSEVDLVVLVWSLLRVTSCKLAVFIESCPWGQRLVTMPWARDYLTKMFSRSSCLYLAYRTALWCAGQQLVFTCGNRRPSNVLRTSGH